MPRFLVVSIVALTAAILFGFVTAAALATSIGLTIAGAVAALIVLSGLYQGTHA
jgi:hypothetical protein